VALGLSVATIVVLPFALVGGGLAHLTPSLLAVGAALAVLSSALPFTLEMRALGAMPARSFSILMSLEPAVAALCGLLFLHERLTAAQWTAVGLVIAASVGATATSRAVVERVEC
jgi:inner membrane transporter RhtA